VIRLKDAKTHQKTPNVNRLAMALTFPVYDRYSGKVNKNTNIKTREVILRPACGKGNLLSKSEVYNTGIHQHLIRLLYV
jgi:hypothetical protein